MVQEFLHREYNNRALPKSCCMLETPKATLRPRAREDKNGQSAGNQR